MLRAAAAAAVCVQVEACDCACAAVNRTMCLIYSTYPTARPIWLKGARTSVLTAPHKYHTLMIISMVYYWVTLMDFVRIMLTRLHKLQVERRHCCTVIQFGLSKMHGLQTTFSALRRWNRNTLTLIQPVSNNNKNAFCGRFTRSTHTRNMQDSAHRLLAA